MSSRKLYSNFISLGLVQLTNFVVPIVMYPYLFRILGATYFGTMMYAFNVMIYLGAFIDYGFNISAPRNIVLKQNNSLELSIIVSSVIQTKLFLLLCCGILLAGFGLVVPRFQQETMLYLFSSIYMLGSALIPTWLFQGLENMKHLTWINLIAKLGVVLFIVIFINDPSDHVYVVGLFGLANLISGLAGLYYAYSSYGIYYHLQPFTKIFSELTNGWYFFTSSFASIAFSNSTIFILGLFVTNDVLGKYSIAEKITFAVWQLIGVFSQVTYPTMCNLALVSHANLISFVKKYHVPFVGLILLVSTALFISADYIILLATGSMQDDTATLLRILSLFPLVVSINVPAYQILLAYEKQRYNALIFNYSALIAIGLTIVSAYIFGAVGVALAAVVTQIGVTLALHITLRKCFRDISLW